MKIILVAVMSANGKITAGKNTRVYDWSSKEDRYYFSALIKKSKLVIMGRKTYIEARAHMILSPKTLRVVMTKRPDTYRKQAVSGELEFTNQSPKKLIGKFKHRGYKEALIVGGGEINTAFIRENLIDELWLTVEPVIFGCGKNLFSENNFRAGLRLQSVERLNKKGTLLLKYSAGKISRQK